MTTKAADLSHFLHRLYLSLSLNSSYISLYSFYYFSLSFFPPPIPLCLAFHSLISSFVSLTLSLSLSFHFLFLSLSLSLPLITLPLLSFSFSFPLSSSFSLSPPPRSTSHFTIFSLSIILSFFSLYPPLSLSPSFFLSPSLLSLLFSLLILIPLYFQSPFGSVTQKSENVTLIVVLSSSRWLYDEKPNFYVIKFNLCNINIKFSWIVTTLRFESRRSQQTWKCENR